MSIRKEGDLSMGFRRSSLLLTVVCLSIVASEQADAGWMTYTETATASGSLGAIKFTNATITFTQTANAASVYAGEGLDYLSQASAVTSTVTISGVGMANLTIATDVFANRGSQLAGISYPVGTYDLILFCVQDYALRNYDLKSAIGPVVGNTFYGVQSVATTRGTLTFQPVQDGVVFTAASATVPEPSTALLIVIGLAGVYAGHSSQVRRKNLAG